MKHVIFYDGNCPLCNRAIRFLLAVDQKKLFYFAPLKGKTAQQKLSHLYLKNPSLDTLVLLQDYDTPKEQVLIEGRGALRILWILKGGYAWIGWLSFIPSFLFDFCYRIVARYRYKLFSTKLKVKPTKERFLP